MPFADHVYLKSDAAITVVQDANDPFDGSGALRMDNTGLTLSNPRNVAMERLGPSFVVGELKGLIRTKINVSDAVGNASNEAHMGIYFMASQLDLTAATGAAYAFVMYVGSTVEWRVIEYSLGIDLAGQTIHASGETTGTPAVGKNMVMSVDWRYDLAQFGGIRIACKAAEGTNYADLEEVYTLTLGTTPLATTVAEGLFYGDLEGQVGSQVTRVWYQDTFYSNFSASVIA